MRVLLAALPALGAVGLGLRLWLSKPRRDPRDRDLDEAREILTEITIHDDLQPSVPESTRHKIDRYLRKRRS